jgi:hypothetical protein
MALASLAPLELLSVFSAVRSGVELVGSASMWFISIFPSWAIPDGTHAPQLLLARKLAPKDIFFVFSLDANAYIQRLQNFCSLILKILCGPVHRYDARVWFES